MTKQKKISVVSPVYNSSKILDVFIKTLVQNLLKITKNYEIILVDDNSTDNTWKVLINLKNKYKNLVIKKNEIKKIFFFLDFKYFIKNISEKTNSKKGVL